MSIRMTQIAPNKELPSQNADTAKLKNLFGDTEKAKGRS